MKKIKCFGMIWLNLSESEKQHNVQVTHADKAKLSFTTPNTYFVQLCAGFGNSMKPIFWGMFVLWDAHFLLYIVLT